MTPPPLTTIDKLQIMERVCGSMMASTVRYYLEDNFAGTSAEQWLELHWDNTARGEALLRHKKGGVYRKTDEAIAVQRDIIWTTVDKENQLQNVDVVTIPEHPVVIYEHIWPHARQLYVRPKAEFEEPGRFVRIVD